jgi:hypothetical protein
MTDSEPNDENGACHRLREAIDIGLRDGRWESLERWLKRELDEDGVPLELHIPLWWGCLKVLAEAKCARPRWPRGVDQRVRLWVRSLLRFARTDGTAATHFDGAAESGRPAARFLKLLAQAYPKSRESKVIHWWLGRPVLVQSPPPLPAWSSPRHPLAALRSTWQKQGDLLVVDQRGHESSALCELIGSGASWLGPDWGLVQATTPTGAPKPACWISNSVADCLEWSYRSGGLFLTRTALLCRGQRLALLGEQVEGKKLGADPLETRLALPPGVTAEPIPGSRGVLLQSASSRVTAQVLPIGLPALPYETERGRLRVLGDESALSLCVAPRGRRCWLPLLASWDNRRHRRPLSWRVLTVSEQSKVCAPDVAFAVRVSWGRNDTLVIYRSLAAPKHRAFLGHQTGSRFLLGRFTTEGVVEPIFSID